MRLQRLNGTRLQAFHKPYRAPTRLYRCSSVEGVGGATRARSNRLQIDNKFVLRPIGDGTTEHIDGVVGPVISDVELRPGVFELGREPPVDIVIPAPTVSGRHALLRITEKSVTVTDLESTNGTYVDNEQLEPMRSAELKVGSQIIFGDEHLANFVLFDDPVEDLIVVEAQETKQ